MGMHVGSEMVSGLDFVGRSLEAGISLGSGVGTVWTYTHDDIFTAQSKRILNFNSSGAVISLSVIGGGLGVVALLLAAEWGSGVVASLLAAGGGSGVLTMTLASQRTSEAVVSLLAIEGGSRALVILSATQKNSGVVTFLLDTGGGSEASAVL